MKNFKMVQNTGKVALVGTTVCLIIGILLSDAICLYDVVYAGNGIYVLGLGPRAIGRGGADIAVADDTLSISLNPAGMTRIQGKKIDFSASPGIASTHFKNEYNDQDGDPVYLFLPSLGYVNNPEDKNWAWGIALFIPSGVGASYSIRHPLYSEKIRYEDAYMSLKLSPALAYQVTPKFSVGFAPSISYNRLDAEGGITRTKAQVIDICNGTAFPGTTFGDLFGALDVDEYFMLTHLRNMEGIGYGYTLGILYDVSPQITIGLSYVSRHKFELSGKLYFDTNRQLEAIGEEGREIMELLPNQGTQGFDAKWDADAVFTLPQKIGIGIAYRPIKRLLIAFDATWIDWGDFFGDWIVKMNNGNNEDINAIIGSTSLTRGVPQNWKDGVIFSIGMEYELTKKNTIRAGYAHGNSIVPSNTVTSLGPAICKDHLTLGWGYRWDMFEFNVAFEHIFKNTSSYVPHHKVASEYNNSKTSIQIDTLHMMYTWHF